MALGRIDKETLVEICHDLDSDDVAKLKFLLKDVAGLKSLMSADIALEIFSALEHKRSLDLLNGRFIAECFDLMGRKDLIRMLNFEPQQVEEEMGTTQFSVSPFRIMLYRICEDLSSPEVESFKFYSEKQFKLTRKEVEKISSVFDLFVLLEKRGIIGPVLTRSLKDMTESLDNRGDLVDIVRDYQAFYPDETIPVQESSSIPATPVSRDSPQPRSSLPPEMYYAMTSNPRGMCVIINNKNFTRMQPRQGTDVDQALLEETFERLGFIIKVYKDLTVKDMTGVMADISMIDHSKYSALIVCILSHGGESFVFKPDGNCSRPRQQRKYFGENNQEVQGNFVFGVDDRVVPVRYLTMYFRSSKCKSLANKPKLFFIQACQGEDMQTGVLYSSDFEKDGPSVEDAIEMDVDPTSLPQEETDAIPQAADTRKVIPDESDFLLGYATVFGYVSYRSKSKGSFYIRSLTENLNKYADRLDLQHILTSVNNDVAEENIRLKEDREAKKQVPMIQTTLRKQLYFFPDNLQ